MKLANILTSAVAGAALLATSVTLAAESKIDTVMKDAFKGDGSLYKKISLGKGSDEDVQKLLEYVKQLPAEKPHKGTDASWAEKTQALIKATENVAAKKPEALKELQKAGNCKACHSEHKEKKA